MIEQALTQALEAPVELHIPVDRSSMMQGSLATGLEAILVQLPTIHQRLRLAKASL